jgi:hypothetical protein
MTSSDKIHDRINALEEQIADLQARWPAHSVSSALMEELDELEEALAAEKTKLVSPGQSED